MKVSHAMRLEQLIDTFNARFARENALNISALRYDGRQVQGRYGNLTFSSHLKPIRLYANPNQIVGHDTNPLVFKVSRSLEREEYPPNETMTDIVCLDRLGRTVHILNYLNLEHIEGYIFLHVHKQHVLVVKKDHGAYFEGIIRCCGLPVNRVVITLTLNPVYESQQSLLLKRLKTYRDRGYATAIQFDDQADSEYVERFREHYLHELTPDFIRFPVGFFVPPFGLHDDSQGDAKLLKDIRHANVRVLIEQIHHSHEVEYLRKIQPDYVQGVWYDDQASLPL